MIYLSQKSWRHCPFTLTRLAALTKYGIATSLVQKIVILMLAINLVACIPPGLDEAVDPFTRVSIDLKDATTRKLAEWQNAHKTDSLLTYFGHENPSYRYFAANAFGSFTDEKAWNPLVQLLSDPVDLVRSAAAHALGQQQTADDNIGEQLIANFQLDSTNRQRESFTHLLQAVGKQAGEKRLDQLAQVQSYTALDTNLLTGLSWAIFYYARRGITSEIGTERALELSSATFADRVRYPALAYLGRYAQQLDSLQTQPLLAQFTKEPNADLRILLASVLGKSNNRNSLNTLKTQLQREKDWRVRTNIIRSLSRFSYADFKTPIMDAVGDRHELVAQTAAATLVRKGAAEDATLYWKMGRDSFPWLVRYKLYQAANQHLPVYFADYRSSINYQLQQRFAQTNDIYQKSAIIEALSAYPWNYRIIIDLGLNSEAIPIQTATVRALAAISRRDDFDAFFRSSSRRVRAELSEAFRRAIESEDVGMIYEAAQPLSIEGNPYLNTFPDLSWAKEVLNNLPLPDAIESYRALQNAINVLEGRPKVENFSSPATNRPISWTMLETAGDAPKVRIHTNKGKIDLSLWPELAPATVSNFLDLAQSEFVNNKPFHRVVPNFVVQGGDPRGDGYGSVNFTIRTETPAVHWERSGIIGMASAGRDTESIQFFITHSGTPHLDGRYTAFGEVTQGQTVVDALRVGDIIERIEIR